MAAGRMVLTDRLGPQTRINELFVENRDIVYYNNEEDCIEKLLYYCKNDEEREHIAKNGREKVLANHTTAHRVDFIIAMWQLRKNPK
jgi:spore maturation protein CgeB